MDLGIKGKRALILGANAGLGKAIAQALVQEGAQVCINGRDEGRLSETAKKIGATATACIDLTQPDAGKKVVEMAIKRLGGLEILVTNAGGPPKAPFMELTPNQWQEGFQSLWLCAVQAIQAAVPEMKKNKWGRVLLVTSLAAKEPIAGLTISNGLRAGLSGLTKSLSTEVAQFGITVNALLPGYTATDRLLDLGVDLQAIAKTIPAGRIGKPEELGSLAAFLASDLAAYVTGQSILFDGGASRGY